MDNLFKPNPESFDLHPALISRKREIATLEEFYSRGGRVAVVTGRRGTGKTALLYMYLRPTIDSGWKHHLFPGGVINTYAFGPEPIEAFVQRHVHLPLTNRTLLVIDEAHSLSQPEIRSLGNLLQSHPFLCLLLASQLSLSILPEGQIELKLGGFSPEEFKELIRLRLGYLSPQLDSELLERFYEYVEGDPSLTEAAVSSVRDGIITAEQVFQSFQNFESVGIIGVDGRLVHLNAEIPEHISVDIKDTNRQLLCELRDNPALLRQLSPRKFEEIVAELLAKQGYEIELTPSSSDGGFDIYAAKQEGIGKFLYLVECKRYSPPNKVGVEIVRALYGVVQRQRANAGVIVTTSYFTAGAKEFQEETKYQIHLKDYIALQQWLNNFGLLTDAKPDKPM